MFGNLFCFYFDAQMKRKKRKRNGRDLYNVNEMKKLSLPEEKKNNVCDSDVLKHNGEA